LWLTGWRYQLTNSKEEQDGLEKKIEIQFN
jgi:hypothetical protein